MIIGLAGVASWIRLSSISRIISGNLRGLKRSLGELWGLKFLRRRGLVPRGVRGLKSYRVLERGWVEEYGGQGTFKGLVRIRGVLQLRQFRGRLVRKYLTGIALFVVLR